MLELLPLSGVSANGPGMPRHMYNAALTMMNSVVNFGNSRGTNLTAISTINKNECQIISRRYIFNRVQNSRFLGFCCLFSLSLFCRDRARISLTHMFALHIVFCLPLSDAKRGQAQQERLPLALRICGRLMNNMHVNLPQDVNFCITIRCG